MEDPNLRCISCNSVLNDGEEHMDYCWRCRRYAEDWQSGLWNKEELSEYPPHFNYNSPNEIAHLLRRYYYLVWKDE